jgi:hypothetical protein
MTDISIEPPSVATLFDHEFDTSNRLGCSHLCKVKKSQSGEESVGRRFHQISPLTVKERFSRAKPFQLSFSKKVLCINAFAHIPTQTSSLQHPFCKVPTIAPFSSQTSTQTSIHSQRKRKASLNVKRKLFFEALFPPFDIVIATGLSFEIYDWARSSFANHRGKAPRAFSALFTPISPLFPNSDSHVQWRADTRCCFG